MSEQNAFDRRPLDLPPIAEPQGLLEQFNLPPKAIDFLRTNSRIIWTVFGCVAVVVITVSLYGSYREYKTNQAASALDLALLDNEKRLVKLQAVVTDYSSTPSADLAKIEMVKLYEEKKQYDSGVSLLNELNATVADDSPLKPLITYKLAALYEKQEQIEKAMGSYTVLSSMTEFEATAFKAMGMLAEKHGNREQAISYYKQYLGLFTETGNAQPSDPARMLIESRLHALEEK